MRKVLGLDIGITSVGWGIIDIDTNEIIDAGVRLFPEASKDVKNDDRRSFRSGRRLRRRRVNRKEDLEKLLKKYNLYTSPNRMMNPYEVRCKGINEKITLEELNVALFHICKHRGSALETVGDENNDTDLKGTKSILSKNDLLLSKGKYVCEIQLERLKVNGKIRGIENVFRSSDYEKELTKLLGVQKIDSEIIDLIIKCILRRRNFSDGPGSFKSPSIYGKTYNEDGTVLENMIEKMTGKCSIFKDQLRAPKLAPSCEFYNLMNDLNNLRVSDEPIDIEDKKELVKNAFKKGSLTPKQISKFLEIPIEEISGFRIDKNSEPLLTKLDGFNSFRKIFVSHNLDSFLVNIQFLDDIAVILTRTKVIEERKEEILNIFKKYSFDFTLGVVEELVQLNKFNSYHSLSLKAIYILNEELYESDLNQMQIFHLSNKFEVKDNGINQKGKKNISCDSEAILSPVALRSYRQAIKVVNSARKKYGEFESIIVETTRDKNSNEEKKRISNSQKYFENENKKVDAILENYPGIKASSKLKTKIRLYLEQECKTAYTMENINLDLLIRDPYAYEIDHIIPLSISLDDSINNKALVSRFENQEKGQMTPLMAFERNKFPNVNIDGYKAFIKMLYNTNGHKFSSKYKNYMYAKDISKYENMKEFIARNLVDTSYANRLIYNTLMNYFKDNEIDTKVHTVKGKATSAFRKRIKGLDKNRDLDFSHHAIDALIVASIKKMNFYNQLLCDFSVKDKDIVFNRHTGEIIESNDQLLLDEKYLKFLNDLVKYKVVKYSHQIDTKPNRSIADQTIYSTRKYDEEEYVIGKISNIYDAKDSKVIKLIETIINE